MTSILDPGTNDSDSLGDAPTAWRFFRQSLNQDLIAVSKEELRTIIRKCHQTLWEGGKRSPMAAFSEFCKLAFIKQKDEKEPKGNGNGHYEFQRQLGETPDELATRINKLYEREKQIEPEVFNDTINLDPATLAQCVEHLEGISFERTELDTKGVAFEEFMGGFFKGDIGQYFTPRELVAFAVQILNPSKDDLVLDPACGSGGFLLYTLDHIRRQADRNHSPGTGNHFRFWHEFAERNLFGIEINQELTRVAKMNMMIHDDGHTNIIGHDSLDFMASLTGKHLGATAGRFDLILTNPPFGSAVKKAEKGIEYLNQFSLLSYHDKRFPNQNGKIPASVKTEILFIERIHTFLKPGTGRAAVILPDGILTNPSLQGIRQWILEHFQVIAVVSLPPFAFSHYDAGVKASMVFLRRLGPRESPAGNEMIFMATPENIGYDATGRKTFAEKVENEESDKSKTERHRCDLFDYLVHYESVRGRPNNRIWAETQREVADNTGIVGQWKAFLRNPESFKVDPNQPYSGQCFAISLDEIEGKLSPDYYHPERMSAIKKIEDLGPGNGGKQLAEVVTFERKKLKEPSEDFLGLSHIRSHTGEVIDSRDKATGACYAFQTGDVLFARLRPYLNKVYRAERDGCCSTEFHVLRVKDEAELLPDYLAAVLRSNVVLCQTIHMMTGNTHPRLSNEDVESLLIPVPDYETQAELTREMRRRQEVVRRLKAEVEAMQSSTKTWFEEQLTTLETLQG